MSSPLKNVSTQDVEKAIAETLEKLCKEERRLTVSISEMKFNALSGSAALSLTVSRQLEPFEEVFGAD